MSVAEHRAGITHTDAVELEDDSDGDSDADDEQDSPPVLPEVVRAKLM